MKTIALEDRLMAGDQSCGTWRTGVGERTPTPFQQPALSFVSGTGNPPSIGLKGLRENFKLVLKDWCSRELKWVSLNIHTSPWAIWEATYGPLLRRPVGLAMPRTNSAAKSALGGPGFNASPIRAKLSNTKRATTLVGREVNCAAWRHDARTPWKTGHRTM